MFLPNENSRASILLGYVREHMHDAGDQVTYEEVLTLLEVDADPKQAGSLLSGVIATVNKRLHRAGDWRHLSNVQTVGYRIANPADIRHEALARLRMIERQAVASLRATEKGIRHPDATPGERKRAADAAAAQANALSMMRRENRKIKQAWPAEEPVVVAQPDDDD